MNISYKWLKDYIELDLPAEQVADHLTLCGLEIEDLKQVGSNLEGIVVGEVLDVKPHPNADRLRICQLNTGDETVQIICGADNVATGQKVPVAKVGAELPIELENGKKLKIKKAKLRGEKSEGMICAEDELGIGDDHSGIMVLDADLQPGLPFSEVYDLYEDTVFDIAITPNRPDATSHIGVARDLSAVLNKELKLPDVELDESDIDDDELQIEIKDTEKCHRYVGKLIRDVEIKESPAWLKNRLTAIGLRPINNVVDVTNYVMYELGQPLHAFDYDEVAGKKIVVQSFDKETTFTTLDDTERKIPADTLYICDGQKPVAIAGVMGGQNSEVSDKTTNILLESAYFVPSFVRKASKNLSLQTDSSYRFERGIDPKITSVAAHRAAQLMAEVSGGTVVKGTMDIHPVQTEPLKLHLRQNFLNRMLGTRMESEQAARILHKLGFKIIEWTSFEVVCEVPSFRPDIEREIDLVEEIGRIIDYNTIPAPKTANYLVPAPIPFHEQFLQKVSKAAQLAGFREIYTNSLLPHDRALRFSAEEDLVETLNPVSKEMTTLRPSMMHGMLTAMAYNFNRNAQTLRFFEIGHTFSRAEAGNWVDGVQEDIHLILAIGGMSGTEHWDQKARKLTAFDLKSSLISILNALGVTFTEEAGDEDGLLYKDEKGQIIGALREVDSKLAKVYDFDLPVFAAELNLSRIEDQLHEVDENKLEAIPRFPAFEFDLAVVVDKAVPASGLLDEIRKTAGPLLSSIEIFDVFEAETIGVSNKSLAFRLHFIDPNKTLNIKDVEPIIGKVLKSLEHKFSAKLRS